MLKSIPVPLSFPAYLSLPLSQLTLHCLPLVTVTMLSDDALWCAPVTQMCYGKAWHILTKYHTNFLGTIFPSPHITLLTGPSPTMSTPPPSPLHHLPQVVNAARYRAKALGWNDIFHTLLSPFHTTVPRYEIPEPGPSFSEPSRATHPSCHAHFRSEASIVHS